jgi:hypothetical protein
MWNVLRVQTQKLEKRMNVTISSIAWVKFFNEVAKAEK